MGRKWKLVNHSVHDENQTMLLNEINNKPISEDTITIIDGIDHKECFATRGVETCGELKPITEFHLRDTARGIRQNQCNDCKNDKDLKHRSIAIEIKKSFIKRIEDKAQCIVKDCYAKNIYKVDWLHFDHIEPSDKVNEINYMVKGRNKATLEDMLNEIHKCNIVCAVHHAWHTKMQQSLNPKYEYYLVSKDSMNRIEELETWIYSIFRKKQNDKIILQAYQETVEKEDLSKVIRWS